MSIAHVKGENNAFLKCEVIIDASVEEVAAFSFLFMSRYRVKRVNLTNTIVREAAVNNNHSFDFLYILDVGFSLSPRRFLNKHIWKKLDGGKIIQICADIGSSKLLTEGKETAKKRVDASSVSLTMLESIAANNEQATPSSLTKLTYINQMNFGGAIPHLLVENRATWFLAEFAHWRHFFDKDYEIDLARRKMLMEKIRDPEVEKKEYTQEEVS